MFSSKSFYTVAVAAVALAIPVLGDRNFRVINNCPEGINIFVNGITLGSLSANGGSGVVSEPDDFSGVFYTNANGGNQNGFNTLRAGFEGNGDYYFLVVDNNHFNTEISIRPERPEFFGQFCQTIDCGGIGCEEAFTSFPLYFPPPSNFAPTPPLYTCPPYPNGSGNGYIITFCPNGNFPVPPFPPVLGTGDKGGT
ncbi:hypothetical protein DXG03_006744 [Asterophora parasitica]|uniref:Uncharacterized protein n=1 Tax=Asterophora parasitica TaxID=117018 RepID=A0A9P7G4X3_9AGAR|nr:hypothetical protein DXG03_006744 [Asterophora parasitica]